MIRKQKFVVFRQLWDSLTSLLWTIVLSVVMLPYQVIRVFWPEAKPGRKGSHPISKMFRHGFEDKRAKRFIGAGLAVGLIFSSLISNVVIAQEYTQEETLLPMPRTEIATKTSLIQPVAGRPAQGFHGFHKGVDILAPVGTDILAIAEGVIIEVNRGSLGWGNNVVIEHQDSLVSRYAHMDKMTVAAGQKVAEGEKIGTVGMTGWTTGPHLHLEMYQDFRAIDPFAVLPSYAVDRH